MYNKNSCYKAVAHEFHTNISLTNCSLCLTVKEEKNHFFSPKEIKVLSQSLRHWAYCDIVKKKMFINIQKIFSAYIEKKGFKELSDITIRTIYQEEKKLSN